MHNYNKTYKVKKGFYEMDEEDKEKKGIDKEEEKEEVNEEPTSKENKEKKIEESSDGVKKETDNMENPEDKNESEMNKSSKDLKQLKNVFFVVGFLVLIFVGVFLFINSVRHFTYEGVDFNVIKEGELIFYQTSLPVKVTDRMTGEVVRNDYNFYFRNDPRKLKDIIFDGKINIKKSMIMNFTENFNCNGYGIIAVANMMNLFGILKINAEINNSLGCNKESQYTFIRLQSGNETGIEQVHTNCYDFTINNCEVLEVTEKYLIEMLIKLNQKI